MSKIIATCLGCEKPITKRTNAMLVKHRHGDGTFHEVAVCSTCMARLQTDEAFATQLNWRETQLPRTVVA